MPSCLVRKAFTQYTPPAKGQLISKPIYDLNIFWSYAYKIILIFIIYIINYVM